MATITITDQDQDAVLRELRRLHDANSLDDTTQPLWDAYESTGTLTAEQYNQLLWWRVDYTIWMASGRMLRTWTQIRAFTKSEAKHKATRNKNLVRSADIQVHRLTKSEIDIWLSQTNDAIIMTGISNNLKGY